jgi:GDP-mannose pyrophosphatase NudK
MNMELAETLADDWYRIERYVISQAPPEARGSESSKYSRLVCGRGDRVAVLPYHKSDLSVVLVQQFRLPVLLAEPDGHGISVELVGGLIDGDRPEDCARRELLEETGLVAGDLKLTTVGFCHPPFVTERVFVFLAPMDDLISAEHGGGIHSENEDIQVLRLTKKAALEMVNDGVIRDVKTVMTLYYLARHVSAHRISFSKQIRNIARRSRAKCLCDMTSEPIGKLCVKACVRCRGQASCPKRESDLAVVVP